MERMGGQPRNGNVKLNCDVGVVAILVNMLLADRVANRAFGNDVWVIRPNAAQQPPDPCVVWFSQPT